MPAFAAPRVPVIVRFAIIFTGGVVILIILSSFCIMCKYKHFWGFFLEYAPELLMMNRKNICSTKRTFTLCVHNVIYLNAELYLAKRLPATGWPYLQAF